MRRALAVLVFLASVAQSCGGGGDAAAPQAPLLVETVADAGSVVQFERNGAALVATWPAGDGRLARLTFALDGGPLFEAIAIAPAADQPPRTIASGLSPRYEVTTGVRGGGGAPYVFFDSPASGPTSTSRATLRLDHVRAEASGDRGSVVFSRRGSV